MALSGEPAERWDVVVVGSGVAGLSAAVEAALGGLKVVVLESEPEVGGASVISPGGSCLVGTPLQSQNGVVDNVELALAEWSAAGGGCADLAWARKYLARSYSDVFRWCEEIGVTWSQLRCPEGNSVARWHRPEGGGSAVIQALISRCSSLRIDFRTSTTATEILFDNGTATGIVAVAPSNTYNIAANATIICTGGFANNRAMLTVHAPRLSGVQRYLCGGSPTASGLGHGLLHKIGAAFSCLDKLWIYPVGTPDPLDESGSRGLVVRDIRSEIWLNAGGERFHDEDRRGGLSGTAALLNQPGQTAWGIFDSVEADHILLLNDKRYGSPVQSGRDGQARFWATSKHAWRSGSVQELAAATGLPSGALSASVKRFNEWQTSRRAAEPQFGRSMSGLRPISQPPFHAVQYFPLVQKNLGGVVTDLQCRVRLENQGIASGLYAAGEVAGMAGGCINGAGALEGTMFGPSLYAGRIAGRAAVRDHASRLRAPGPAQQEPRA